MTRFGFVNLTTQAIAAALEATAVEATLSVGGVASTGGLTNTEGSGAEVMSSAECAADAAHALSAQLLAMGFSAAQAAYAIERFGTEGGLEPMIELLTSDDLV